MDVSDFDVLVVDDDATMQVLLQAMVESIGARASVVGGGQEALDVLSKKDQKIDLILMDQNMPDIGGLEVAERVRDCEVCCHAPVIIQSASSDLRNVRKAIDSGVNYYLSKPFEEWSLKNALGFAAFEVSLVRALRQRLSMGYLPGDPLRSSSFVVKTHAEMRNLSILLAALFPNSEDVLPGINAMLFNAIEHGVLDIGYEGKSSLFSKQCFIEEIERREALKKNQKKEVEVQFVRKDGRFSIRITDPGKGFDWKRFVEFDVKRESFNSGYGILKALRCFDEVKYNTAGNQVMLSVFEQ